MSALPTRVALGRALAGIAAPALLLAAWQALAASHLAPAHLLPSPADVVARFRHELAGTFWQDVGASLRRVLDGFFIGGTVGLALGLLLGLSRFAERLLGPSFLAYRQVALFAWVPLLSMWFGGGEAGKIAFVALSAFAPAVVNTWRAVRAIPASYRELAAVLTFRRIDFIALIALPGALPGIVTGLRTALIYAWIATVGAELFLDIAPGLGGRLNEGRDKFEVDLMLVALATLALTGLVFAQAAALCERKLLQWRPR
jgi:sulfonate transport system permease protein